MKKALIFISHLTVERDLAFVLRDLINESFAGVANVFISSDPESIPLGDRWLDQITNALSCCCIEIILASPNSVKRPWINFEAGCGWIREVPVVPLCHSGMSPDLLPPPLSSLQGAVATNAESVRRLLATVANAVNCAAPNADVTAFVDQVCAYQTTSEKLAEFAAVELTDDAELQDFEVATLSALANLSEPAGAWTWPHNVVRHMERNGYFPVAANLGIESLRRRNLVEVTIVSTTSFDDESAGVRITTNGWSWLFDNRQFLQIRRQLRAEPASASTSAIPEDDIPF